MRREQLPLVVLDGRHAGELGKSIEQTTRLVEMFGPFLLTQPGGEEAIEAWHRSVVDLGYYVARQAILPNDTTQPDALPAIKPVDTQAQRPSGSIQANIGTFVYVAHDENDQLLYVGVTDNLFGRMVQHQRDSPWWPDMARLTWEEWPDRQAALRKEARLIKAWRPPYNKAGNPDR